MSYFPPPNSGQPPAATPAQVPGMVFVGYGPDGQPQYAPAGPPQGAPPAAPYAAPAAPYAPQPYQQPYAAPAAPYAPQGPAPGYGAPSGYGAPAGGEFSFGDVAWQSGIQMAGTYVVRLEDIEAGISQAGNEKLVWTCVTVQPQGTVQAGAKHVWNYSLSEKAIGKLGRDAMLAGVNGKTRYPRDARGLAGALLAELRGVQLVIRVEEQKDGQGFNTSVVSRYNAGAPIAPTPPQAPAPASAPTQPQAAPAPGQPAQAISFPQGPPPPAPANGTGFASV